MRSRRLAAGVALTLASVAPAHAQQTEADRTLVGELVAALNSGSLERRLALVHPGTRVCTEGEGGEWWREAVARQARDPVPPQHTARIAELAGLPPFGERFDYPVRPTHQLQLDYAPAPHRSRTLLVLLARASGRWMEVVPCATADTLAAIRARRQDRAREAERIKALAARTPVDVRERVLKLYRSGRGLDAYQAYAQTSGEDLATAKAVVELLAEGAP
jgi:hypothetical protein